MGEWKPIETAPKDGRTVLDLWCITEDPGSASFYFGATKSGVRGRTLWHGRVTECCWQDGAWRPYAGLTTRLHPLAIEPTHWMSLPIPPAPRAPGEEGG